MGVPKEIREVPRPVNTVVCDSGNDTPLRYSVRERAASGKYSRGKNPMPKNGRVIGHIIDLKFVPADRTEPEAGSRSNEKQESPEKLSMKTVPAESKADGHDELSEQADRFLMYGAPAFAKSLSGDILDDLLGVYDINDACSVLVMAVLRNIVPGITDAEYSGYYRSTFLRVYFPGTHLSKSRISSLVCSVGDRSARTAGFWKKRLSRLPDGHHIALGSTRVSGRSGDLSDLSGYSCIRSGSGSRDLWAVFAYDAETMEPLCTELLEGSVPDADFYESFLLMNGIRSGILIAGDGFSPHEISGMPEGHSGLHYIMPVGRTDWIMEKYGLYAWDHPFKYCFDLVLCHKAQTENGKFLYAFRSLGKAADDENSFLNGARENGRKFDGEKYRKLERSFGTSLFESDLELPPETVYRAVESRWLPELLFRQSMSDFWKFKSSWWDVLRMSGIGLIFSISALITVRMLNAARDAHLLDRMNFGELMERLRLVRRMEEHYSGKVPDAGDGRWSFPDKSSMEILAKLGLVSGIPEAQPERRGRTPKGIKSGTR